MSVPLLIENVPFDLDETAVGRLCAPYGQVTCVRVPRTPRGRSLGVAYVEVATQAEAEQVCRHLHDTAIQECRLVVSILTASSALSSPLVRVLCRSRLP